MSNVPPLAPFDLSKGIASRVTLADGHRMPVLGLGVWRTPPGNATQTAVGHALRIGYRSIDTAAMYGNEADVGEAIRTSGIPRDELFVTTKVWNDDQGFQETLAAFDRSQRALDVGVVDLYLVHWPVSGKRLETWKALLHLQRDGRCRSIGVSNFTVRHLEELREQTGVLPAVNQVEFNPFLYQRELLEYCRGHRIQLEAWAPLVRAQRMSDPVIQQVARAHHATPAQILVRWGLQHEVVEIPKSVHSERIAENAGVFEFRLSPQQMAALDGLNVNLRTAWDPSEMA